MFEYRARIVSAYDGDTIRGDIDLGFGIWTLNQPIRVYGINAPERYTVAGDAARAFSLTLLPEGTNVVMTTFKDKKEKYGRYLGKITLPDGSDYSEIMVAAGHAVTYFGGAKV
jgi:micrococcal nuclease